MQIQTTPYHTNSITEHDKSSLTIGDQKYNQTVLISRDNINFLPEFPAEPQQINIKHLNDYLAGLEVLIIGGDLVTPLTIPSKLTHSLFQQKISLEPMNLGAACRTFNIMLSEARSVACLIMF